MNSRFIPQKLIYVCTLDSSCSCLTTVLTCYKVIWWPGYWLKCSMRLMISFLTSSSDASVAVTLLTSSCIIFASAVTYACAQQRYINPVQVYTQINDVMGLCDLHVHYEDASSNYRSVSTNSSDKTLLTSEFNFMHFKSACRLYLEWAI